MKYQDFLIIENAGDESSYRKSISYDDAINLFIKNCKDMDVNFPYFRAAKKKFECAILEGQNSSRESRSNHNYHNIVIDKQIEKLNLKYPLRYKSIIAIGHQGNKFIRMYGSHTYAIYPFDDVTIMKCNKNDILYVESIRDRNIYEINTILNEYIDINYISSFDELVDLLHDHKYESGDYFYNELNGKTKEDIAEFLYKAYDIKLFKPLDTKTDHDANHANEVWIGGKCIAIHLDKLIDFKSDVIDALDQ